MRKCTLSCPHRTINYSSLDIMKHFNLELVDRMKLLQDNVIEMARVTDAKSENSLMNYTQHIRILTFPCIELFDYLYDWHV